MPQQNPTRRAVIGAAVTSAAVSAIAAPSKKPVEWKPRLGVLGKLTEANAAFASKEGFNNMILSAGRGTPLDAATVTDADIEKAKALLARYSLSASALQVSNNHIAPDADHRERDNSYFVKTIEMAGKLGVPYIGTQSGKDANMPFERQVEEIVKVYETKYFKACEQSHVRILWEPWPGGPNIATSPVGFEALFKAFGDSPYVGLQYDPSHLVWQMMDPIQTAKDFVDRIYDVHLKDTEIYWDVVRRGGINPVDRATWWRYRIPGLGSIKWSEFFSVLQKAGYQGAMSVEHEDDYYGAGDNHGPDFSEPFRMGFRMAYRYLKQYVPV